MAHPYSKLLLISFCQSSRLYRFMQAFKCTCGFFPFPSRSGSSVAAPVATQHILQSNSWLSKCSRAITVAISSAALCNCNGPSALSWGSAACQQASSIQNTTTAPSSQSLSRNTVEPVLHLHLISVMTAYVSTCPPPINPANVFEKLVKLLSWRELCDEMVCVCVCVCICVHMVVFVFALLLMPFESARSNSQSPRCFSPLSSSCCGSALVWLCIYILDCLHRHDTT